MSHGVYYHGQSCPLVHAYFGRYGYRADRVFARYAPPYRYDYGYGDRYDRGYGQGYGDGYYERYRGYRDHDYDDHHGRRRGRHHHHRGCGHHGY